MTEKQASNLGESRDFVVSYVKGLKERTMVRKDAMVYGLDWVLYQLALAKGWDPQRLPFARSESGANHKTEPEYGIDLSFLRDEGKELIIFVLKDEPLKNKTWSSERIKDDLEKAMYPRLSSAVYDDVVRVCVVLAYNKDEDQAGIELFDRFVENQTKSISGNRELHFERWNLTSISDEVHSNLLSPALLPEGISDLLRYAATHFKQCQVGSDSWIQFMLPNWDNLISQVLDSREQDYRKISILSMSAVIMGKSRGHSNGSDVGYIELVEKLMLRMWDYASHLDDKSVKALVSQAWVELYLSELERFYQKYGSYLRQAHAVSMISRASGLDAINAGFNAYWHLARIGLFTYAIENLTEDSDDGREYLSSKYSEFADIVERMIYNEPGSLRPLIDAHQAQVFLIWRLLAKSGRIGVLCDFLNLLVDRLLARRINKVGIPFIDGHNSYKIVAEAAGTKEMQGVGDQSSFFCLALMEYCIPIQEFGSSIIEKIYRQLVLGIDGYGEQYTETKPLDLICWAPKEGWELSMLKGKSANSVGISLEYLHDSEDEIHGERIVSKLRDYKDEYLLKYPIPTKLDIPSSVMILACLTNDHALPPYLWRGYIYDQKF
ncbi:MAG: hypothetical protein CML13_09535 [Puniceicoccaceae bacterium]|nr:hypothetical protein [Puniceicoccaceae bacterium]|tara:strand:+ start:769 stop:2589 length:1821 start_codon:yes stop_codon:yes gene_type:complete